jgi:hypothetical protein
VEIRPSTSAGPKIPSLIPVFRLRAILSVRGASKQTRKIDWLSLSRQGILSLAVGINTFVFLEIYDVLYFVRKDSAEADSSAVGFFIVNATGNRL